MVVVVFGANGQLGKAIQTVCSSTGAQFHFFDSIEVDITKNDIVNTTFKKLSPDFCINAAAYTAVDKAEIEKEQADLINHFALKNITSACLLYGTTLLHISTDFVFDGSKNVPYLEDDETNPKGIYGFTKRQGELEIVHTMTKYFIIRTSWLYSDFGNNFKKTMLRLATEKESLSVVTDQIGSPTNAVDLAEVLIKIILSNSTNYGIYHFSNEGSTSWYGFAKQIFEVNHISINLIGISTSEYPTLAQRPQYSVLDTSKIKKEFNLSIKRWEEGLQEN